MASTLFGVSSDTRSALAPPSKPYQPESTIYEIEMDAFREFNGFDSPDEAVYFASIDPEYDPEQYKMDFLNDVTKLSHQMSKKWDVPVSIFMAVSAVESGHCSNKICRYGKNHFAIKAYGWKGDVIYQNDDCGDKECAFRRYKNRWHSFNDFGRLMDKRYRKFLRNGKNYKSWARAMKKGKYASGMGYDEKIIRFIEKANLQRYD